MPREAFFAKIHVASVTECNLQCTGPITIDQDLLDATRVCPNAKVLVADSENANRYETA